MKNVGSICRWFGAATMMLMVSGAVAMAQDNQDRPTLNKDKQQTTNAATERNDAHTRYRACGSGKCRGRHGIQSTAIDAGGGNGKLASEASGGRRFLQKYPQSHYRPVVYTYLTVGYIQLGQADKAISLAIRSSNSIQMMWQRWR